MKQKEAVNFYLGSVPDLKQLEIQHLNKKV